MRRRYRQVMGGMWEEIGGLQFEFMVGQGLKPEHKLLDVGCGAFRAGVHFVRYLEPGNYYGVDKNRRLLDAGVQELREAGLDPEQVNWLCVDDFSVDKFGVEFDYALAHSLFTHLNWNQIQVCLCRVGQVLRFDREKWGGSWEVLYNGAMGGGKLFATFFEDPGDYRAREMVRLGGTLTTYPDRDPYHYTFSALVDVAVGADMVVRLVEDWDHPRGQRMLELWRFR